VISVIPRLWVCTDPPLVLKLLALPLHALVLLGLVIVWGTLRLTQKSRLACRLGRLSQVLFLVLGCLTLCFAVGGMLLGLVINPSSFLGLAPWAWAIAGPIGLVFAVKRARRETITFSILNGASDAHLALLTTTAVLACALIASRYVIFGW
jgi:hypothetical protein